MKLFRQLIFTFGLFLVALFGFCLPDPLFQDPVSDVIFAADSTLLGARLASDGQWRFPEISRFPEKIEKSIVLFEDKHFFYHPGIDPAALVRAFWSNFQARRIVSGGSTLTMQLIRLSRKGKPRIWSEKLIEVILATRLELSYSKNEILSLYLSHAPFGGNVVGAEAAAWRYFGHSVNNLSWAESATLAVLPNAPALIHPGR
ncbi:MAG: transglycosylase domain-containing protein, partial [Bacteroidales bacterium]